MKKLIEKEAIITKISPSGFEVLQNGEILNIKAKGKIKLKEKLTLGDRVRIENNGDENIISEVFKRKNHLMRPEVANIDNFIIVVASSPEPDFNLIDILIAMCFKQNINVTLCINKCDIATKEFIKNVKSEYEKVCDIFEVSAKDGTSLNKLKKSLLKTTAFAGQSGVGKTSIINAIFNLNLPVGKLAEKTERGKHTTKQSYFYLTGGGDIVIDTPGFSFLDFKMLGITPQDYKASFPDFAKIGCKYSSCTHTGEQGCALPVLVAENKVSALRVERYVKNYKRINAVYLNRYK